MTSDPLSSGCVALTGATGFVGGHVLRQLAAAGWTVRALTRRADGLRQVQGAVLPIVGALDSADALAELVDGADAVVHCAGLVAARRTVDFQAVNTDGTANLVRAAVATGHRPRFVLISSLAAREPTLSPYAGSKRAAEEVLRQEGADLPWQVLRPPVVYGPGDRATLDLFRQFAKGFALLPRSTGRFSMVYVEDLADAVVALLQAEGLPSQIMELDDGRTGGYSWGDLLTVVEAQLGRRVRYLSIPRPIQRVVAAASSLAAGLTGGVPFLSQGKVNEIAHPDWVCRDQILGQSTTWRPKVGFDEGFPRTLAWYKAEGWL